MHNGAFFPEKVTYNIHTVSYDNLGQVQLGDKIGEVTNGQTEYALGYGADKGKPRQLELAVTAKNAKGESEKGNVSETTPFIRRALIVRHTMRALLMVEKTKF